MIQLTRMTQKDFDAYLEMALPHLADELATARDVGAEEGKRLASESFRSLFPEWRVDSPDQFVFNVIDDQSRVGFLHFGIKRDRPEPYVYIWDISIDAKFRGKGYGKQVMLAAESKAVELGLKKIRLNVFGHNTPAVHLYERIGYQPESIAMEKSVGSSTARSVLKASKPTSGLDIWHVAIPVKDLARSVDFYCGKLGLGFLGYDEQTDKRQAFVFVKDEGFTIELFEPTRSALSESRKIPDHLAFECEDIGVYRGHLLERGLSGVDEVAEFDNGVKHIGLKDPDGVTIDLFQGRNIYERSIARQGK